MRRRFHISLAFFERFRGNQTEHHISSRYSKGRSRRETSENFAIEIERKGEGGVP